MSCYETVLFFWHQKYREVQINLKSGRLARAKQAAADETERLEQLHARANERQERLAKKKRKAEKKAAAKKAEEDESTIFVL